jgi:hypothetical protein
MKTTLSVSDFRDAFARMDRKNQFTYEALGLIYEFLEDINPDWELDVIAVCCDFDEQAPIDIAHMYGIDISECEGDDDKILATVREYLHDYTSVVGETAAGNLIYIQY